MRNPYVCMMPGCLQFTRDRLRPLCDGHHDAVQEQDPTALRRLLVATAQWRQCYPCFRDRVDAALAVVVGSEE